MQYQGCNKVKKINPINGLYKSVNALIKISIFGVLLIEPHIYGTDSEINDCFLKNSNTKVQLIGILKEGESAEDFLDGIKEDNKNLNIIPDLKLKPAVLIIPSDSSSKIYYELN